MPDHSPSDVAQYVRSTARFLDLPLSDEQVERVAIHLARTRTMVEALHALQMLPEDEPSEIYLPAPFPEEDPG